jgi:hypothetical protein
MCNCNGYIHNKIQCTLSYVQILKNKLKSYTSKGQRKEQKVTMCESDNGLYDTEQWQWIWNLIHMRLEIWKQILYTTPSYIGVDLSPAAYEKVHYIW